jgi:hypothetical protein
MKVVRHLHTPSSRALTEIYAWVCTEPDGSEGIIAASMPLDDGPGIMMMPLVGGDLARMRSLRHHAEQTRGATGWPVRLMRFSTRTTIEELP